jgi:hypothetical protein
MGPGRTSDGVLPGLFSGFLDEESCAQRQGEARTMQGTSSAMRYEDEQDPKKPQPVSARCKGDNPLESQEYRPRKVGPDDRRDHHRHVHRC